MGRKNISLQHGDLKDTVSQKVRHRNMTSSVPRTGEGMVMISSKPGISEEMVTKTTAKLGKRVRAERVAQSTVGDNGGVEDDDGHDDNSEAGCGGAKARKKDVSVKTKGRTVEKDVRKLITYLEQQARVIDEETTGSNNIGRVAGIIYGSVAKSLNKILQLHEQKD